jgi:hypothetical protein
MLSSWRIKLFEHPDIARIVAGISKGMVYVLKTIS